MPLFTTSLQNQDQASSAGVYSYPLLTYPKQFSKVSDELNRTTLNASGAIAFYVLASNDGNGTVTMNATGGARLTTDSSAAGDDASLRLSELDIRRVVRGVTDSRSKITLIVTFALPSATSTEGFIGFMDAKGALAALPTTGRHMGVYWDASAGANFMLTSADGTSQSTTDTTIALATSGKRIEIVWNGDDSATLSFFSTTTTKTPSATQTVTSLNMNQRSFQLHFFVQTETTAAKTLDLFEWMIQSE